MHVSDMRSALDEAGVLDLAVKELNEYLVVPLLPGGCALWVEVIGERSYLIVRYRDYIRGNDCENRIMVSGRFANRLSPKQLALIKQLAAQPVER